MQNVKFLAGLFLKLQENGPLLSARPRTYAIDVEFCSIYIFF